MLQNSWVFMHARCLIWTKQAFFDQGEHHESPGLHEQVISLAAQPTLCMQICGDGTSRAEPESASPWMAFSPRASGSNCTPASLRAERGAPRIQVQGLCLVASSVPIGMSMAKGPDMTGLLGSLQLLRMTTFIICTIMYITSYFIIYFCLQTSTSLLFSHSFQQSSLVTVLYMV